MLAELAIAVFLIVIFVVTVLGFSRRLRTARRLNDIERRRLAAVRQPFLALHYIEPEQANALAQHLIGGELFARLQPSQAERTSTDEAQGSLDLKPAVGFGLSRRSSNELRELFDAIDDPGARLTAILVELRTPGFFHEDLVVTNAVVSSAIGWVRQLLEDERKQQSRRDEKDSRDGQSNPAVDRWGEEERAREANGEQAVRLVMEALATDGHLMWIRGQFRSEIDQQRLVLSAEVADPRRGSTLFPVPPLPVAVELDVDELTPLGRHRLHSGSRAGLELLAIAQATSSEPPRLGLSPIAIFSRAPFHQAHDRLYLPPLARALPQPLRHLAGSGAMRRRQEYIDVPLSQDPMERARQALRGEKFSSWWFDRQ